MHKPKVISIIVFLLLHVYCFADGLMFKNKGDDLVPKTSLDIFAYASPVFFEKFSVKFELEIRDPSTFGYVFRLTDHTTDTNIYSMVFSYNDERTSFLKFNIEDKEQRITDTLKNYSLGRGKWLTIWVDFYLIGDSAAILINNDRYVTHKLGLPNPITPILLFGSKTGIMEEIPIFSIRNLIVGNDKKKYLFPLNESSGEIVHDSHKIPVGKVASPNWLINESYYWKKCFSYNSSDIAGCNFDNIEGRFFVFDRDSLIVYDVLTGKEIVSGYRNGMPLKMKLGTNYYDPDKRRIYAYELADMAKGAVMSASLEVDSLIWNKQSYQSLPTQRHHHSSCFDPKASEYFIFGGFGNRMYSQELMRYSIVRDRWDVVSLRGDRIDPRFFSSMGKFPDGNILIFGGMGNPTGDQTVGRVYYCDLYKIDLRGSTSKKLWKYPGHDIQLVPVRNLIVSDDGGSFYTMCTPVGHSKAYMKLYKFSIQDGTFEILGDSVPTTSKSILTNSNIYFLPASREFYCYTQEYEDGKVGSTVNLYSIASAPVSQSALNLYLDKTTHTKWHRKLLIWIFLTLATAGIIIYFVKKKNKRPAMVVPTIFDSAPALTTSFINRNAVYLFGDFKVFDGKGRDVTHLFSSRVRQMFFLLLFHSSESEHRLSSTAISDILWPEKSTEKAKNLRGVIMSNLRKILVDIDGLDIRFEENTFQMEIKEPFYCDYLEYLDISARLYGGIEDEQEWMAALSRLVQLLTRGRFLMMSDHNYFDRAKANFEDALFRMLTSDDLPRLYTTQHYRLVMELASILYMYDPVSEVALWFETNTLRNQKNEELSRKRYNYFCVEYKKLLGVDYSKSYKKVTTQKFEAFLEK